MILQYDKIPLGFRRQTNVPHIDVLRDCSRVIYPASDREMYEWETSVHGVPVARGYTRTYFGATWASARNLKEWNNGRSL